MERSDLKKGGKTESIMYGPLQSDHGNLHKVPCNDLLNCRNFSNLKEKYFVLGTLDGLILLF